MLVNGAPGNSISLRDRGLLYGDGVFRTLLVRQGQARHWSLHLQKLQHDCAALGIPCPDAGMLQAELAQLTAQYPDGVFKLIVTRGQSNRGYALPDPAVTTHVWDVAPVPEYPQAWLQQGVRVRQCALRLGHQPRLAGIKHLNRLENVLATAESADADMAEGILLDQAGNVIEGIRSNVFAVKQDCLMTPDLSNCGVAGVQRDRILALATQIGLKVAITQMTWDDLVQADEVFLTNSVIGIWAVRELQDRLWHDHPVTQRLRTELND